MNESDEDEEGDYDDRYGRSDTISKTDHHQYALSISHALLFAKGGMFLYNELPIALSACLMGPYDMSILVTGRYHQTPVPGEYGGVSARRHELAWIGEDECE